MATYSIDLLSGSTDGLPIVVAATASPGTTIHTAVIGSSSFDEVYLWASNVTGSAATLTVQWGSTSDPGGMLVKAYSIGANSLPIPIAPGLRINNASVIRAFSGTASAINITGNVNRIAP